MELVYLWVKDYKNIQKQGFNFSPRFECEFKAEYETDENGKEKLKDNCKLVINPKEHLENFFGKNINVTAIVGENGSGKSSLLELMIIIQDKNVDFQIKGFMIIQLKGKLFIAKTQNFNNTFNLYEINKYPIEERMSKKNIHIPFVWIDALNSTNIKENKKLQISIQTNTLFYKFDSHNIFTKHLEILNKNVDLNNILDKKYYFDSFKIILNPININYMEYWKERADPENNKLLELIKEIEIEYSNYKFSDTEEVLIHNYYIAYIRFYLNRWTEITSCVSQEQFTSNMFLIINDIEKSIKNLGNITKNIDKLNAIILEYSKGVNDNLYRLIKNDLESNMYLFFVSLTKDVRNIFDNNYFFKNINTDSMILKSLEKFCFNTRLPEFNFILMDLVNSKTLTKYNTLSNGEKQLLDSSLDLIYSMMHTSYINHQVMIFDEIDSYLHPKWAKELINMILNIISKCLDIFKTDVSLNLIFSTHSPFILSDLPKENVIFLEKGVQKYPFKDNKQTFGANIHTLLSHGFFMEGGLMGEFAKSKINEVIDFHKRVELEDADIEAFKIEYEEKRDKFWQTQSIIGEDYLKQVVKNHLVEIDKILLGKDGEKQREITRLRAEADKLEGSL